MNAVRHRGLPLALVLTTVVGIAACDSPTAPAALKLDPSAASVDSSTCTRGFLIVQGVVQCNPDPG